MALLDQIANLISVGHREAIKAVLTVFKRENSPTPRELELEAKRLVAKLNAGVKVSSPILVKPEDRIRSSDHNSNMENTYIDLSGLYKQTDLLSNLQIKQKDVIIDEFTKARSAILKLINDARVFAIRNRHPEFDDIKVINFNSARNTTLESPGALVDPDSRLLKLPSILKRRAHLAANGSRRTNISVNIIGGKIGNLGKQFPPEKSADARPETFWAELVYSDIPIQNVYNRWGPDQDGAIANDIAGPLAVIKLSFSGAEAINQVRILPFADGPIKVLEVSYRPTASSRIRYAIKDFQVEESLDWIEFNFETIFTTDIEIVLAQENARHVLIHVPKSILYATDFLLKLQEEREKQIAELPDLNNVDIGGNDAAYSAAIDDLSALMSDKVLEKTPFTEVDLAGQTVQSMGEVMSTFSPNLSSLLQEVSSYTNVQSRSLSDEIETINRYEYLLGAREIECNYVVYSPVGLYSSEKFEPKSTVANVEIEVDERHSEVQSQFGSFSRTSTEWEVEFAEDRKVPIYPSNKQEGHYLEVKNELLPIDPVSLVGLTRFKSFISYALIRENDKRLTANSDYTITWDENFNGRLQVSISEHVFNRNKIYTIDYYADPSAKSIDVISLFNDKALAVPDVFDNTGPNNSVQLSTFPYINFNLINSEDFTYLDTYNAYQYTAPVSAYSTGMIHIEPTWLNIDGSIFSGITGSSNVTGLTGLGTNFSGLNQIYLTDPYRYYLKLTNIPGAIFEMTGIVASNTTINLAGVPLLYTGVVGTDIPMTYFSGNFTGVPPSGYLELPYSIEVVRKAGDQIFGFDNILYEPIDVEVGGVKAKNITAYQSIEQPAFNVADASDGEYEYIHDGNTLYFNQQISSSEIQVSYRWLTKYVRVNCILRSHKIVSPTITPQVNEYRLLLSTTIL